MPPRASSMPQPPPAVSPDHTNETARRSLGAVRKCPTCRPSSNALAVKSVSGRASTKTALRIFLKLSLVATSTSMRDARSARAQTIAESTETSPDWTPWVMTGRSAARLSAGLAIPPAAAIAADEAAVVKKRRRVSDAPLRMTAIGPPPSNHLRESCPRRLTGTRHLCDSHVKASRVVAMRRFKHAVAPACGQEPRPSVDRGRQTQDGHLRDLCPASAVVKW